MAPTNGAVADARVPTEGDAAAALGGSSALAQSERDAAATPRARRRSISGNPMCAISQFAQLLTSAPNGALYTSTAVLPSFAHPIGQPQPLPLRPIDACHPAQHPSTTPARPCQRTIAGRQRLCTCAACVRPALSIAASCAAASPRPRRRLCTVRCS